MLFNYYSEQLNEIRKKYNIEEKNTGSSVIQIALFTFRINDLSKHFAVNKKDKNSKKGFLTLISQRKKMLKYLEKKDPETRSKLLKDLNIRK